MVQTWLTLKFVFRRLMSTCRLVSVTHYRVHQTLKQFRVVAMLIVKVRQ